MRTLRNLLIRLASLSAVLVSVACSPQYNWREVQEPAWSYSVLMPDKPASVTRAIDLNGTNIDMNMLAAEVSHVTFAVGAATLSDAAQAHAALASMRTALLRNISGQALSQPIDKDWQPPGEAIELVANGNANGHPIRLMALLVAKDARIYQVLMMGDEHHMPRQSIQTFFTSFQSQ
ncbi:hypothetical protein FHW67_003805 [Herbaspirillum sp. Sphag1AN]|uniref:hypothetical protein n=1 Tax=unclassified Herbaspirillum TaxID=2624150 RepID=UPI001607A661|nr:MULTISPECIES: hypothetical protein [unclassified Herbaspirillum]MBB3214487.1 hypothetical protein [Herbaspirillum sp. Sphag1AN]MBB3247673.1 hypothetical protein [Herbaspirillum sp. Sphag64]